MMAGDGSSHQLSSFRALEFYSGIGGFRLALSHSCAGHATDIVAAFDWDQIACQVYAANFGPSAVHKMDISTLMAAQLSQFNARLWLLSPSCQPYTVLNPSAKGAADPRAQSFLHLINTALPQLTAQQAHPRYILMENVAGFQDSSTRHHLTATLANLGYVTAEFLLNPLQFGIPNSRLRYYLLAKVSPLKFAALDTGQSTGILDHIPETLARTPESRLLDVSSPTPTRLHSIREYLEKMDDETFAHYKVPDRVLQKWGRLFDIVLPSSTRSCCFTRGYTRLVERAGSILQMNEDLDTTEVFDEFLEAQSGGNDEAVRKLDCLRLRYFTPTELLGMFYFVDRFGAKDSFDFVWPPAISQRTKYRLIGNSVNVEVVRRLINYLLTEGPGC
ncbi:S-adenosyl-L-methionine-dependent methyltransferase [Phlebopus sp. FC_14]|nr:S-adenosyl-L-methionine-dependent methyltransferase [Phlebopus sp. FC_14]